MLDSRVMVAAGGQKKPTTSANARFQECRSGEVGGGKRKPTPTKNKHARSILGGHGGGCG